MNIIDKDILDRNRQLDKIIGSFRIIIALFIIFVELYLGRSTPLALAGYAALFFYSSMWLLFQTRHPSQQIGIWGYYHFAIDLVLMGAFTLLHTMSSYHDGLYIILVLIYLVRFGKKPAIVFSLLVSLILTFACFKTHFEHSLTHFVLLGTLLAIIYFVGNIMDLEKSLREKLRYLSNHDELTGVYNFRYFQEQMEHEQKRSNRYQHPLSLVVFDIDNFKEYNDTYGHDAGNVVLSSLASLLKEHIRQGDILARFGGEEFALLMPETDKIGAVAATERIRQAIESHDFPHRKITISAGVALYPEEAQDTQELFQCADQYLYQAKACGRNCTKF